MAPCRRRMHGRRRRLAARQRQRLGHGLPHHLPQRAASARQRARRDAARGAERVALRARLAPLGRQRRAQRQPRCHACDARGRVAARVQHQRRRLRPHGDAAGRPVGLRTLGPRRRTLARSHRQRAGHRGHTRLPRAARRPPAAPPSGHTPRLLGHSQGRGRRRRRRHARPQRRQRLPRGDRRRSGRRRASIRRASPGTYRSTRPSTTPKACATSACR